MSIAELDTLYAVAVAAMDAADYDTAILKLLAVKARLATTPNLTRSMGGGGSQAITWNASEIDSLIRECRNLKTQAAISGSGGVLFRQSKITYARAETTDDYA